MNLASPKDHMYFLKTICAFPNQLGFFSLKTLNLKTQLLKNPRYP